jgi:hypothetical protein
MTAPWLDSGVSTTTELTPEASQSLTAAPASSRPSCPHVASGNATPLIDFCAEREHVSP